MEEPIKLPETVRLGRPELVIVLPTFPVYRKFYGGFHYCPVDFSGNLGKTHE